MIDKERVLKGLDACMKGDCDSCPYNWDDPKKEFWDDGTPTCHQLDMMKQIRELLAGEGEEPRMLTPEEVRSLPDGKTIIVEQLLSREDEERGYITGTAWAVNCNRSQNPGDGLLVSMLGSFFPNTVLEIPYATMGRGRKTNLFRFWTARPTEELSKSIPWGNP